MIFSSESYELISFGIPWTHCGESGSLYERKNNLQIDDTQIVFCRQTSGTIVDFADDDVELLQ